VPTDLDALAQIAEKACRSDRLAPRAGEDQFGLAGREHGEVACQRLGDHCRHWNRA
jgi:hypothetical protein